MRRLSAALLVLLLPLAVATSAVAAEGQLTWAVHISLAPTWFEKGDLQARARALGVDGRVEFAGWREY